MLQIYGNTLYNLDEMDKCLKNIIGLCIYYIY